MNPNFNFGVDLIWHSQVRCVIVPFNDYNETTTSTSGLCKQTMFIDADLKMVFLFFYVQGQWRYFQR